MPAPNPGAQRATAAAKIAEAKKIQDDADALNKGITEAEEKQIFDLLAESDALQREAARREQIESRVDKLTQSQGRLTDELSAESANAVGRVPAEARDRDLEARHGFRHMGEFASAVYKAQDPSIGIRDKRLDIYGAASGLNQKVGADGGFLVPPSFSTKIWDGLNKEADSLLAMTDSYTVDGESITFPANAETSRATGSRWGGVRAYWAGEAGQITPSKPAFRQLKLEPQELVVLVYCTDKLLKNSPVALDQYIQRAAVSEINFMTSLAIFSGDGSGKPKGYTKSAAVVSVAKETNQAAKTILELNLAKMWARLHVNARANAVWFINQDCEAQLDVLSIGVKNIAGTDFVGGYQSSIYNREKNTIKGRPVMAIEFCETLGTVGDIVLADMSAYATGFKGGIESAMSIHLRFDYNESAFRFIYAVDGQSWLASALTPFKGSDTLSTIVTLATRA